MWWTGEHGGHGISPTCLLNLPGNILSQ
jgi:hypothetical protein